MNFGFELLNRYEECLPIKSLDELKNWQPSYLQKSTTVPLQKRSPVDSPKTLVCHDMKGGYLEDRFLHGLESEEIYYFIHWSMVDIFVYFSHHLVTIPPCGWISAGHRNGVKVLGTFITEWDAGVKICDSILNDVDSVHQFCMQLVNIANFFQFDGWLINIENKLSINQIPLLEEFVEFLTQKMHESQKDSLVIWYDSVIQSGELKWQNELNEHNRNFFLRCDGIFLNYNWTKDTLKKSVDEAGTRRFDVFVGVDVFGRGCLGGGGFSTDIAVTAARDFNLSVAIFAPGWVYECCDSKDFKENQYKFWNALTELCAPRVIEGLPYYTSFCPGFGKEMFRNGKVVCSEQWFNLSLQQPQPSFHYTNCSIEDDGINNNTMIIINNTDAFNGGGCLQLKSKTSDSTKSIKVGLLSTNFLINSSCCISYAFKSFSKNTEVSLVLSMYNNKKFYDINFGGHFGGNSDSQCICICSNCEAYKGRSIQPISVKAIEGSDEEGTPWIKRKFKVNSHENENCFVKKVSLLVSCEEVPSTEISVLLGELSISPCDGISFTFKDLSVVPKNESSLTVECLLEWTQDNSIYSSDLYVIINGKKKYVWTTSQFWYNFKSCMCNVPEIEFILIPNYRGKTLQPKSLKVPLNCDEKAFHVAGHT